MMSYTNKNKWKACKNFTCFTDICPTMFYAQRVVPHKPKKLPWYGRWSNRLLIFLTFFFIVSSPPFIYYLFISVIRLVHLLDSFELCLYFTDGVREAIGNTSSFVSYLSAQLRPLYLLTLVMWAFKTIIILFTFKLEDLDWNIRNLTLTQKLNTENTEYMKWYEGSSFKSQWKYKKIFWQYILQFYCLSTQERFKLEYIGSRQDINWIVYLYRLAKQRTVISFTYSENGLILYIRTLFWRQWFGKVIYIFYI
jgi:hypothetical protein